MAKKTRTELSTLAINTNLPDNTQELITPTTERSQLTDERESVVNYKDDLGGAPNAGKFLTVATDGESLTMVDAPTGDVTGTGEAFKIAFWFDTKVITFDTALFFNTNNNRLTTAQFEATLKVISAAYEAAVGSSMTFATGETGDPSPTTRLTISSGGAATFNGDISLVNETTTTSQATLAIKGKQTTAGNYPVGEIVFFNNNDSFATIAGVRDGANDKGALLFQTQNGTAGFGTRLTISSGGVVNSYYGISFPNQSASSGTSTSETLDAYEEGTWTPTFDPALYSGSAPTGFASIGTYTRIGNTVRVHFAITWGAWSATGKIGVKGLPYPNASGNQTPFTVFTYGMTFASNNVANGGILSNGQSTWLCWQVPVGGGNSSGVDISASGEIQCTGIYKI